MEEKGVSKLRGNGGKKNLFSSHPNASSRTVSSGQHHRKKKVREKARSTWEKAMWTAFEKGYHEGPRSTVGLRRQLCIDINGVKISQD